AAKELGNGGGDGRDLVGDDVALTLGHVEEFGPVLLRGSPGTALLGTLLVGAASNEVTLAGVLELQLYQGAAELVEGRDGVQPSRSFPLVSPYSAKHMASSTV